MPEPLAVGVDVGGTKIAAALVDTAGTVLAEHVSPTGVTDGVNAIIDRIAASIEAVRTTAPGPVRGVGVGVPGPVDAAAGIAGYAVNMGPGWADVPLRAALESRLAGDLPVWIENDVNAGALGEMIFGAARGCNDFVYAMLGTGLGGGAVIDGRLLRGVGFLAMEIGHIAWNPAGRPGDFGLNGTTEIYASGKGFLAALKQYAPDYPASPLTGIATPSARAILEAAQSGDQLALRIVDEAAEALGTALAWCATILNPARIVIGGGLGHAARPLLDDRLKAALERRVMPDTFAALTFAYSEVTHSALGPAALVFHHTEP
jgi:glucokinase